VARVAVLIVGWVKVFGKNWGRCIMQDYIDELSDVGLLDYGVLRSKSDSLCRIEDFNAFGGVSDSGETSLRHLPSFP
jgi:hypothetical protein